MGHLLAHIQRQFAHDQWANEQTLRAIQANSGLPERAGVVMAHIVAVEWLYLSRLQRWTNPVTVWPLMSLDETQRQLERLRPAWTEQFDRFSPEDILQEVSYTNSAGEHWTNTVLDLLTHVPTHSAYHRGQIGALFIRLGEDPPYTDYIEAARRGMI